MAKNANTYDESDIVAHEGLDAVRARPSMYIGELGTPAVNTLLREAIDNALDEALAGRNDTAQVGVTKDGWFIVADCGQGIPVGEHPKHKKSTLEILFTMLHAGGKFNYKAYSASRGTHGVGNKAITALSSELHVYTFRDNAWWTQSYSKGKKTTEVTKLKDMSDLQWYYEQLPWPESIENGGTLLAWQIDKSIIGTDKVDESWLVEYLTTIALLNSGFYTGYKDSKGKVQQFSNEDGPSGFINYYAGLSKYELMFEPLVIQNEKVFKKLEKRPDPQSGELVEVEVDATYKIEVALQLTGSDDARVWGYTNCGFNSNGGMHISAFWDCFYDAIKKVAGKDSYFTERDVQVGMLGYVNWGMSEPQFSSQTKERLVSKVSEEVWELCTRTINKFLSENDEFAQTVIQRAEAMAAARGNAAGISALAKALKDAAKKNGDDLPSNLQQATSKPVELFVVEGDSAGGHAKYARIAEHQEVLPLRGKVTNVERKGFDSAISSKPIMSLLQAMQFDPKKAANGKLTLRHERIFITADADPDGQHINLLVCGALWLLVPQAINEGRVFIVDSPLYLAIHDGQEFTAETLDELKEQLPANFDSNKIVRAKGLGELTPEWMVYTVFNPETRKVRMVTPPSTEQEETWFKAIVGEDSHARKVLLGIVGADGDESDE